MAIKSESILSTLTYGRRLLVMAIIFVLALSALGLILKMNPAWMQAETRQDLLWVSVIQDVVGFIIPSLLCAFIFSRRPFAYLCLDRGVGLRVILGLLLMVILAAPAINQIVEWNNSLSLPASLKGLEQQMRTMEETAAKSTQILLSSKSFGGLLVEIALVGILVPFSEELFFRGTLQRTLASGRGISPHLAIWVTAFIFSAVHFQFFGFFPRLLLGVFFGYLVWWTGSIWSSTLCHVLNNSIVVVTTWGTLNGHSFATAGFSEAVKTGFPWAAVISAALTAIFLIFFRKRFFFRRKVKR